MLPLHNTTDSIVGLTDESRIGKTNDSTYTPAHLVKLNVIEKMFHKMCHLPTRFDLMSCEEWLYPKYLTYTNINKYIFLYTHSYEFNIKFFLNQLATIDWKFINIDLEKIFNSNEICDKYKLVNAPEEDFDTIFFLPGSNIDYLIDYSKISETLSMNDDALIKPHPLTSAKHLGILGNLFGWDKIIEPNISGYQLVNNCKNVYHTDNSELGLHAYLKGKNVFHFNMPSLCQPMVYHPFYHILRQNKNNNLDKNGLINAFFNTSKFGMFNLENSMDTIENDLNSFLHDLECFRQRFAPEANLFDRKTFEKKLKDKKEAKKDNDKV